MEPRTLNIKMSQISKDVETVYRRLQVRRVTTEPFYVTIRKPMNINCESFHFLHFHIAIISFIFQLNAHVHLNVCIALLNVHIHLNVCIAVLNAHIGLNVCIVLLNAHIHLNVCIALLNVSYIFWRSLLHPQGELLLLLKTICLL
jgi:hypothetical protein